MYTKLKVNCEDVLQAIYESTDNVERIHSTDIVERTEVGSKKVSSE